jgi:hypothetical protein
LHHGQYYNSKTADGKKEMVDMASVRILQDVQEATGGVVQMLMNYVTRVAVTNNKAQAVNKGVFIWTLKCVCTLGTTITE